MFQESCEGLQEEGSGGGEERWWGRSVHLATCMVRRRRQGAMLLSCRMDGSRMARTQLTKLEGGRKHKHHIGLFGALYFRRVCVPRKDMRLKGDFYI